ncbi:MAG: alpha-glucosidase, partial [Lachnospiraceae bacterium]|nr:alpha-glucosidase [Lachnospiraceae bacterium]
MKRKWWHDKVAYQIYPKSFCDSNGDGIGAVRGIISRLDYLKDLGVDILWLSPIYKSPFADEGYDIADYYSIDPRFGTMEDVEELIAEAKKRDMYILMDLVVNHCSDEHEWFKMACRDPEGRYGRFFYLRDKNPDGSLPTNWRSYFGGPCWDELPGTDKLYLHVFHKKQPDLNWENPEVRAEVYKNINWWLEKGLGGFRVDAIINIKKPMIFQDYPVDREDGYSNVRHMLEDARGIGVFLSEMQEKTFSRYDAFSVGEVFNERKEEIPNYIGENGYFSSMFDFAETIFGASENGWYDNKPCLPDDYKACVFEAQKRVGTMGFLSNIIENHDEPRGVSRYIPAEDLCDATKKLLATMYFLLRGIPFIYQGQELGMENREFRSVEEFDDISSIDQYKVARAAGLSDTEALKAVSAYSRDNARTPMQWNAEEHAGFTSGSPWLVVNENYKEINAEKNLADPDSLYHYYQKLIRLRKNPDYKDILIYGTLTPYLPEEKNLMAYIRQLDGRRILVAGNYNAKEKTIPLPEALQSEPLQSEPLQSEPMQSEPLQQDPGQAPRLLLGNLAEAP